MNNFRDTTIYNFLCTGLISAITKFNEENKIKLSGLKKQWSYLQRTGNVTVQLKNYINVDNYFTTFPADNERASHKV